MFEYLTIRATVIHSAKVSGVFVNGAKQNEWKDKELHELLNHYGLKGWELVFVERTPGQVYIFKRAKP